MEFKCPEKKFKLNFTKYFVILNQNQNITFVLSSYAKNGVLGGRFMVFGDLWLFLYPGFALFLAWLTSPSVSGLSQASSFRQNIQKVFPPFFFSFCSIFLVDFHYKLFEKYFVCFFDRSKLYFFSIFGTYHNLIDGINSQMR